MWHPYGDIDDPMALALGRLVWASISLEGLINRVCAAMIDELAEDVSSNIKAAIAHAKASGDEHEATAVKWLKKARPGTYLRNQILHSAKIAYMTVDGRNVAAEFFENVRRGDDGKEIVTWHDFTVDGLDKMRAKIERVSVGWRDADVALALR